MLSPTYYSIAVVLLWMWALLHYRLNISDCSGVYRGYTLWCRYYNTVATIKSVITFLFRWQHYCAQLVVACPTPVRAAENWLEPRDREAGKRENQIWIIATIETHSGKLNICWCVYLKDPCGLEQQCACVNWKCLICHGYWVFKSNMLLKLKGRSRSMLTVWCAIVYKIPG